MARPLLCAGVSMLLVLAMASTAEALERPILTGTNPISPGASPTPRVKGVIEESETKAVDFGIGARATGPIARALELDNTVRLYTEANCTGPIVGEDTVEVLIGEGILVDSPVPPDSVTLFYATQSNGIETSDCSSPALAYRQVTTPPSAPVLESTSPASPANDNFPHLLGSADPEATVSIFVGAGCGGSAVASGLGAQFASPGIQVAVADNSETTFSARVSIAGFVSGCSASSIVYREETPPSNPGAGPGGSGGGVSPGTPVSPPPPPRLRTVPGGSANDNTPLVSGSALGATAVRIYASASCEGSPVAKGSAAEFAAGIPVRVVDNDVTVFSAVSIAGELVSKCSDPVAYVEDSLTPRTRITMGPAAKTAKRKAVLRFMDTTGNAPGTTFLCKVDKRKWKRCASPLRLSKLRPKRYVVRVKAIDPAGNAEARGAKRGFKVIGRR